MENQNKELELLEKIKVKLQGQTPKSRLYGRVRTFIQMLGVIALFLASALVMSLFLYDFAEKTRIYEFVGHPIFENIFNFFFELLIIVIIGVAGIYFIYRNTDWPFVKERLGLLVGSFVIVSLLGAGTVTIVKNFDSPLDDFIDNLSQKVENISPFREYRQRQQELDLQDSSSFIGLITLITPEEQKDHILTVQSDQESKKFKLENELRDLKVGDKVIIRFEEKEGEFLTLKIEKI